MVVLRNALLCIVAALSTSVYGHDLYVETYSGYFNHPEFGDTRATWKFSNGVAIYNGDSVYGSIEDFTPRIVNTTWSTALGPHLYVAPKSNLTQPTKRSFSFKRNGAIWPKGVIRYKYLDGAAEAQLSPRVNAAMGAWKAVVPCIKFVKVPNSGALSRDVLTIRPGDGCHSTVGHLTWHDQQMFLGKHCLSPQVLHEVGHILGLQHENQRPDSARHVQFVCENVEGFPFGVSVANAKRLCCNFDGPGCGTTSQFMHLPAASYLYNQEGPKGPGSAYDLQSVMHYRADAFAKPGKLTLIGAPRTENTRISPSDAARARSLYCH